MKLDLDKLEALARAATPGPWSSTHWNCHAATTVMRAGTTSAIAETTGFGRDATECAVDAAFIAAANPAAVLALIGLARRATAPHAGPAPDDVAKAHLLLEQKWGAEGDCASCGWHAALGEHDVDDDDIIHALQNGGILTLACLSKDDDTRDSHRGISINLAAAPVAVPAEQQQQDQASVMPDELEYPTQGDNEPVASFNARAGYANGWNACRLLFIRNTEGAQVAKAEQLISPEHADHLAWQVAQWTKERDRLNDLIRFATPPVAVGEAEQQLAARFNNVWNDALEEAAKGCETLFAAVGAPDDPHPEAVLINGAIRDCIDTIRELKYVAAPTDVAQVAPQPVGALVAMSESAAAPADRAAVLEEAAKVCDDYARAAMPQYRNDANGALCCARNIRALATPTTQQGDDQ